MSYIPSFFTTASLPFKNVNKTTFTRKGSQGVTLTLTSPTNVPFGKFGRLLLSVLTTHAVLSKEKNAPVMIEYRSLADLLKELQLPKQRGKEVKEQLECFKNAAFCFEQRIETLQAGYLFEDIMEKPYPKGDVRVETVTTGNIRFTTGVQYQKLITRFIKKFPVLLERTFMHGWFIEIMVSKIKFSFREKSLSSSLCR